MKKMSMLAVGAMALGGGQAFAFAPAAGDLTAITAAGTDLLLWASPVIGIALVILGYRRVRSIVK